MADINFNIETLIEQAIVEVLKADGLNAVLWEDLRQVQLHEVIKVRTVIADEEPGTVNTYSATRCLVDIAVFSSKKQDPKGRSANKTRGLIRKTFYDSSIVTRLNAVDASLEIYPCGVYPQGSFTADDDKNWGKGLQFMVVAKTKTE